MIPTDAAFSRDEYLARLDSVRHGMVNSSIDGLLLFGPANINYLTGFDNEDTSVVQCLIVSLEGSPLLIVPTFDVGRVTNSSWLRDAITYQDENDLVRTIGSSVRTLGLASKQLAIERRTARIPPFVYCAIIATLKKPCRDAFGVVENCRRVKSHAELRYLRQVARLTDHAMAAACEAAEEGARDSDIAASILQALYKAGSDPISEPPYVAAGYRAGTPHSSFNGHRLRRGETVLIELTGCVRRYVAPLMHTVVIGSPSPLVAEASDISRKVLSAILRSAMPGVPACDVARAALDCVGSFIDDHGLLFHYRFGESVGLGYPPIWTEDLGYTISVQNSVPLTAGMVFHLPISLRRFGEFGVAQSHTIVVTETGAEPLTQTPAELHVVV